MAIHNVEVRTAWGNDSGTEMRIRVIGDLRDSLIELQNSIAHAQSGLARTNFATGQNTAKEWCVAWTNEELGQAVHAPMHRSLTHSALIGMQPLAERFGAKAIPVETGVAIIGCAPAIADAVLQGWPQHEARIHLPRRSSTYRTHCDHETDARLSSPSAGHDLTWIIATGGQVHPTTVAAALFDVLGEFPTAESVCALNPGVHAFEQMIQVTAPAQFRQRMHMGPGADGSILIDGRNHRVYPFTEVKQQGRHRASDGTREARLLGDVLGSNPDAYASTVFAQVATVDICADEFERARSVPVMKPLGRGIWNTIRCDNGSTPAAYAMPTLGTHLALALWPESADNERSASAGVTQDVANEVRRAAQAATIVGTDGGDPMRMHSRYKHSRGNVMIALAPGDMIITAVAT